MNRRLIDFYRGEGRDGENRTLEEMWSWSDDRLESCHDYIQWWFPTLTPSNFNEYAPKIDEEDMILFREDPIIGENFERSFHRFLLFLGLEIYEDGGGEKEVATLYRENDPLFDSKRHIWSSFNHNHLRITRVLESMRLLGQRGLAELFLNWLIQVPNMSFGKGVSRNTIRHWVQTREWDEILNEDKE